MTLNYRKAGLTEARLKTHSTKYSRENSKSTTSNSSRGSMKRPVKLVKEVQRINLRRKCVCKILWLTCKASEDMSCAPFEVAIMAGNDTGAEGTWGFSVAGGSAGMSDFGFAAMPESGAALEAAAAAAFASIRRRLLFLFKMEGSGTILVLLDGGNEDAASGCPVFEGTDVSEECLAATRGNSIRLDISASGTGMSTIIFVDVQNV